MNSNSVKIEELEKRINALSKELQQKTQQNALQISQMQSLVVDKASDSYEMAGEVWSHVSIASPYVSFYAEIGKPITIFLRAKVSCYISKEGLNPTSLLIMNHHNEYIEPLQKKEFNDEMTEPGMYEREIIFTRTIIPKRENNYIWLFWGFKSTSDIYTDYVGITELNVVLTGANVEILTRRTDLKVAYSHGEYYITKQHKKTCEYIKINSTYPSIQAGYSKIPEDIFAYDEKIKVPYKDFVYVPAYLTNLGSLTIEKDVKRFFYIRNESILGAVLEETKFNRTCTYGSCGYFYNFGHPLTIYDTKSFNIGFVSRTNAPYCTYFDESNNRISNKRMTYCGTDLESNYVDVFPVFAKVAYKNPSAYPQTFVLTSGFGEVYFYPGKDSEYRIYLGIGHQVSAIMETDKTIYVYMTWKSNVTKRKLVWNNSISRFELTDEIETIPNCLGYIQGVGSDCFMRSPNGRWEHYRNRNKLVGPMIF